MFDKRARLVFCRQQAVNGTEGAAGLLSQYQARLDLSGAMEATCMGKLIRSTYELEVTAKTGCCMSEARLKQPIIINDPQPQAAPPALMPPPGWTPQVSEMEEEKEQHKGVSDTQHCMMQTNHHCQVLQLNSMSGRLLLLQLAHNHCRSTPLWRLMCLRQTVMPCGSLPQLSACPFHPSSSRSMHSLNQHYLTSSHSLSAIILIRFHPLL